MGKAREQREYKEIKTRPLKQEVENLKLDLMELEELAEDLYNSLKKTTELLEETIPFTNGRLKDDSEKITKLIKKLFLKKIND